MNLYPDTFKQLIDVISKLPGIGSKTAEKLALNLNTWSSDRIDHFSQLLISLSNDIQNCQECGFFAEDDLCQICNNSNRDKSLICVVEGPAQVPTIERSGSFNGVYHILHGKLSPMRGIGPDEINILELIERCKAQDVKEVIIATGTDLEGQATASYISQEIQKLNVQTSRIAQGIPLGADLNYADSASIAMAINKRMEL